MKTILMKKRNDLRIIIALCGEPLVFDVRTSHAYTGDDIRRAMRAFAAVLIARTRLRVGSHALCQRVKEAVSL